MELTKEVVKQWIDTDKVSLDQVWEMVGYSSKHKAKERLLKELEEGVDYHVTQTGVMINQKAGSQRERIVDEIIMTKEAFKVFAASAHTEKGKEVRRYLVKFEQENKPRKKAPELVMAEALFVAQDMINKSNKIIEEMKPKADFFDKVTGSKVLISIQDAAKVLNAKKVGQNKLFAFLRERKILDSKNQPYQIFVDRDFFKVIEVKWDKKGDTHIALKTMVTQKGLNYIRGLMIRLPKQFTLLDRANHE